jgi:hypothetical protein
VNKLKPHIGTLLLLLIFVVLSASTVRWTLNDKTPPAWDPADHISAGYDYYAPLARGSLKGFVQEFFVEPHYYAPFVHLVTALIFLVFGASRLTGIGVNFISLAVLLFSVQWISRNLYLPKSQPTVTDSVSGPQNGAADSSSELQIESNNFSTNLAGVLAALLTVCYHFSAWLLHDGFLDYPLMAIVAASFALLIKAGDFQKSKDAIFFGLVAGCGMLTKQTFAFFFLLPALYVILRVLLSRNLKAVANLTLAGILIAAISAVWYSPHLREVIEIYHVNQAGAVNENEAPVLSMMSNLFYTHGLVSPQIQLPFGLLFLTGLIYSFARRRKESMMLYLWLSSGLASFTMVANKDLRYTIPILPAVALLSACWVNDVKFDFKNKSHLALKLAPEACITVWCLVSFFNAQWPLEGQGKYIDSPRFRWMVYSRNYFGFDHKPLSDDWGVPEIVRTVDEDWRANPSRQPVDASLAQEKNSPQPASETVSPSTHQSSYDANTPVLGVVINLPYLNPSNVALYSRFAAKERGAPALIKVDWLTSEGAKDRLQSVDYLLVRTGLDTAEWLAPLERIAESLVNTQGFKRVAAFPIPLQKAEAVLYRRVQ